MPPSPRGFNESAALLGVTAGSGDGLHAKRIDAAGDLLVTLRFETAIPDVEASCGVTFAHREGGEGVRLELPEPLRFTDPGVYVLSARAPAATLRGGGYEVRADAVVSSPYTEAPS